MTVETLAKTIDLAGRTAIVTGANAGVGYHIARLLGIAGASVTITGRRKEALSKAESSLKAEGLEVQSALCDQSDSASIKSFTSDFIESHKHLDILILNAGIMAPRSYESIDGVEKTWTVNHLANFVLVASLYELMGVRGRRPTRVITQSSGLAHSLKSPLPAPKAGYDGMDAYKRTKFANLVFVAEGNRRSFDGIEFAAAHPGVSSTTVMEKQKNLWFRMMNVIQHLIGQAPDVGAHPCFCAASEMIEGSKRYWEPSGMGAMRGLARAGVMPINAMVKDVGKELWELSEELTGMKIG